MRNESTPMPAVGPATVLVVDDEPGIVDSLQKILERESLRVLTAGSGGEALDLVRREPVSVLVTDLMMPGMSGADLLDALRHAGVTVPVILMSGKPMTLPEGFFGFLSKPFDLRELAYVVTAALHHERTERD